MTRQHRKAWCRARADTATGAPAQSGPHHRGNIPTPPTPAQKLAAAQAAAERKNNRKDR